MKVSFYLYCRLPLGRLLGTILDTCHSASLAVPQKVLLTSRESREDLPIEEILRSAAASASDSCDILTNSGEIGLAWLYGPRRDVPRIWGTLRISEKDLDQLKSLLNELCRTTGATYGVCDLEDVRRASMRSEPDQYGAEATVSALNALFWYNYFGPEYRGEMPLAEALRAAASEATEIAGGGLLLLTRRSPTDQVEPERIAVLAQEWPVFRKYNPTAAFRKAIWIDYSQVWGLAAPVSKEGPIREIVGPSDEFIASVAAHAQRFHDWVRAKGLPVPRNQEDFLSVFHQHEAAIRDELLVPAIAAYGEMVRTSMGGVWKKAELLHRGEPVVAKFGRPWTARRVILEVLEGLEPIDV